MLRLEKVATPAAAVTLVVPASVPPPALLPIATVTVPANPVATLPLASNAVTCTAGVITAPATVLVGCPVNTNWLAAPTVMLNALLVAPVAPAAVAVSVYALPTLSMLSVAKLATPATAATVVVPPSVATLVPVPAFRVTVTLPVNPVATFPNASRALTWIVGLIALPATAVLGSTVNASCVAVPTVILKAVLVAPVTPVAGVVAVSV